MILNYDKQLDITFCHRICLNYVIHTIQHSTTVYKCINQQKVSIGTPVMLQHIRESGINFVSCLGHSGLVLSSFIFQLFFCFHGCHCSDLYGL